MILFYPKEDWQLFKYKLLPTGALISRSGALIKLQSRHDPNINTDLMDFSRSPNAVFIQFLSVRTWNTISMAIGREYGYFGGYQNPSIYAFGW